MSPSRLLDSSDATDNVPKPPPMRSRAFSNPEVLRRNVIPVATPTPIPTHPQQQQQLQQLQPPIVIPFISLHAMKKRNSNDIPLSPPKMIALRRSASMQLQPLQVVSVPNVIITKLPSHRGVQQRKSGALRPAASKASISQLPIITGD